MSWTILIQVFSYGVFFWAGCYLLVRAPRTPLIILSIIGMFAQASFFAGGVFGEQLTDAAQFGLSKRITWWNAVVPALIWFHVSSLIARQPLQLDWQRPWPELFTRRVVLLYTLGACLIVLGSFTDLLMLHSQPLPYQQGFRVNAGPGYFSYILFIVVSAGSALYNLARAYQRYRNQQQALILQQLKLLLFGGFCFLLGGIWLSLNIFLKLNMSVAPGNLLLVLGLLVLVYGLVLVSLLLAGQNIRRDFLYNFTSILLLNLIYVGILGSLGQLSTTAIMLLIGLVIMTHTAFDAGRTWLDRLFFNRDEQTARAEARNYATALAALPISSGTHYLFGAVESEPEENNSENEDESESEQEQLSPELQDAKLFRTAVRRALTSLKSPPRLAQSPLLSLPLVVQRVHDNDLQDNRLNRVAALREILLEQIEGLRPSDDASPQTGDSWRFYNVLYIPYVREFSRKSALAEIRRLSDERRQQGQRQAGEFEQVLEWFTDIDEDTYYKWQRRASDTIATNLWEDNANLSPQE
jgi:hypothetical protein